MSLSQGTKVVVTTLFLSTYFAWGWAERQPPQTPEQRCQFVNNKTEHSPKMRSQIYELCVFGMDPNTAIRHLKDVYQTKNLNPERAVELIKAGANLQALRDNPDPWRGR